MVNNLKDIKVGDTIFVVSAPSWLNKATDERIGNFIVTKVNGSSFYAHQDIHPSDASVRFSRKTAVAVPFPGTRWVAHPSEKEFNINQYKEQQHTLMLDKVRTQAKHLTTEELEQVHALMKSLIPKRVLK